MAGSWDQLNKQAKGQGAAASTPAKPINPRGSWDALNTGAAAPAVNKFGTNVSGHAFNPLNPNNQINAPLPTQSVTKNFGASIGSAFKTTGNYALDFGKQLQSQAQQFTNPSPTTRAVEQQQSQAVSKMPFGLVNNPITSLATKAVTRAFTPMVEGLGNEIGTFASDPRNPANLPQDSLQSFLNAANFGVAIGGAVKVLGEEAGTKLANKTTTLRITPDEIQVKLANGEIKNPYAVKVAEELVKRNQSLEVTGTEPTGGLKQKVGTALRGEIKPANPQFKFSAEPRPTTLGRLNPTETQAMLSLDEKMNSVGRSAFKQSSPVEYKKLQELTLKTGDPSQFVDKTVLDAGPIKLFSQKSKVGQNIEQSAIEKGLANTFNGTAEYSPITIKDQAAKAANLINNDLETAKKIVLGEVPVPDGLRAGTMIKAMEDYAVQNNDVDLLRGIANSPLTAETSLHAQELRVLAERNPHSVVEAIKKVRKAREAAAVKRHGNLTKAKAKMKTDINNEIKKAAPKAKDWASFIDEIRCT